MSRVFITEIERRIGVMREALAVNKLGEPNEGSFFLDTPAGGYASVMAVDMPGAVPTCELAFSFVDPTAYRERLEMEAWEANRQRDAEAWLRRMYDTTEGDFYSYLRNSEPDETEQEYDARRDAEWDWENE